MEDGGDTGHLVDFDRIFAGYGFKTQLCDPQQKIAAR